MGRRGHTAHGHPKRIMLSMCVGLFIQEIYLAAYLPMMFTEVRWYVVIRLSPMRCCPRPSAAHA